MQHLPKVRNKALLAGALALVAGTSLAAPDCIDLRGRGDAQTLQLVRGKSTLKRFCTPAAQVTVGAPEIANVVVPNASEVVIVARSVGTTNLIVSTRDGRLVYVRADVTLDGGAYASSSSLSSASPSSSCAAKTPPRTGSWWMDIPASLH